MKPNQNSEKRAILCLEDHSIFSGSAVGPASETIGEIVFNTGMLGYPESLTDPSYHSQILVQTWPLIGNYGVPNKSITNKQGIPLHFESNSIKVSGYIVSELFSEPEHWSNQKGLNEWLSEEKIPTAFGFDTRELTKTLREHGAMLGLLKVCEKNEKLELSALIKKLKKAQHPNERNLVSEVSIQKPVFYGNKNKPLIAVIDCGVKYGIIRKLLDSGLRVVRVPFDFSAKQILSMEPAGIIVSNGPGDPKKCTQTISCIKKLFNSKLPMLGICLGTQLIALAAGAKTYKLKFGHRGQNHPVQNLENKKCYISSQNHGFAVKPDTLSGTGFKQWFENVNDKTVEGIKHREKWIKAIQFHPEASPGPTDTAFLLDEFAGAVKAKNEKEVMAL